MLDRYHGQTIANRAAPCARREAAATWGCAKWNLANSAKVPSDTLARLAGLQLKAKVRGVAPSAPKAWQRSFSSLSST